MRLPGYRELGVSVQTSVQSASSGVSPVRTDVAGFLGFAERGPTQVAVRVESWGEYQTFFGGHVRGAYLAYAVQGFFANGGRACWIVRLASERSWGVPAGRHEHLVEILGESGAAFHQEGDEFEWPGASKRMLLRAVSPGTWGRNIDARLVRTGHESYALTLQCPGTETEVREGNSIKQLAASINSGHDITGSASTRDNVLRDGASNLVRACLQIVLPLPDYHPETGLQHHEGVVAAAQFDLVLNFGDYRAWGETIRAGWVPYEHEREPDTRSVAVMAALNEWKNRHVEPVPFALQLICDCESLGSRTVIVPFVGGRDFVRLVQEELRAAGSIAGVGSISAGLSSRAQGIDDAIDPERGVGAIVAQTALGLALPTPRVPSTLAEFLKISESDVIGDGQLIASVHAAAGHSELAHSELGAVEADHAEGDADAELRQLLWLPRIGESLLREFDAGSMGLTDAPTDPDKARGLQLLEEIDEVGVLAFPDASIAFGMLAKDAHVHDASRLELDPGNDQCAVAGLPVVDPNAPAHPHGERTVAGAAHDHDHEYRRVTSRQCCAKDVEEGVQRVQRAMIQQCERRRNRIALLDVPRVAYKDTRPEVWREEIDSSFAALYYPWLQVATADGSGLLAVPPCGHLAGVMAQVENTVGVHRSAANVVLSGCLDTEFAVEARQHAELNDVGVNVIQSRGGRGVRAMGARTLQRDPGGRRFLPVRRMLNWVTESLEEELSWTVFEPAGVRLWEEIERVVRAFMVRAWRRGMLDGSTEADAFHVTCDATNNTIGSERVVCEVGLQPALPVEYVVVQIVRLVGRSTVSETEEGSRG